MEIVKVEYAELGKIYFKTDEGNEYFIREPMDVILIGIPIELASKWIIKHYGFLL